MFVELIQLLASKYGFFTGHFAVQIASAKMFVIHTKNRIRNCIYSVSSRYAPYSLKPVSKYNMFMLLNG